MGETFMYAGRYISIEELEKFTNKKLNEIKNLEDVVVDYLWEKTKENEYVTASS
jgi:hypothetical protein